MPSSGPRKGAAAQLRRALRAFAQTEQLQDQARALLVAYIDAGHLSQKQLADRIGVPKQRLSDVIHGRRPLSIELARKIEEALFLFDAGW
jgi:plasmid maintenance system antidote protein VapI